MSTQRRWRTAAEVEDRVSRIAVRFTIWRDNTRTTDKREQTKEIRSTNKSDIRCAVHAWWNALMAYQFMLGDI